MADSAVDYNVIFDASSTTCPSSSCIYSWDFGDGSGAGSGQKPNHVYNGVGTYTVTLTASDTNGSSTYQLPVTSKYVGSNPTKVSMSSATTSGLATNCSYSVSGGISAYTVKITWGDGSTTTQSNLAAGQTMTTHAYISAGTYTGSIYVVDSGVNGSQKTSSTVAFNATVTLPSVSGTVTRADGTTLIGGAYVYLMQGTTTKKIAVADASGNYTFTSVPAGSYTVKAVKSGYTFTNPPAVTVGASSVTGVSVRSTQ